MKMYLGVPEAGYQPVVFPFLVLILSGILRADGCGVIVWGSEAGMTRCHEGVINVSPERATG